MLKCEYFVGGATISMEYSLLFPSCIVGRCRGIPVFLGPRGSRIRENILIQCPTLISLYISIRLSILNSDVVSTYLEPYVLAFCDLPYALSTWVPG